MSTESHFCRERVNFSSLITRISLLIFIPRDRQNYHCREDGNLPPPSLSKGIISAVARERSIVLAQLVHMPNDSATTTAFGLNHSALSSQQKVNSALSPSPIPLPAIQQLPQGRPVTLMLVDKLNGSGLIRPESPEPTALAAPFALQE